jgi:hypothetical protein
MSKAEKNDIKAEQNSKSQARCPICGQPRDENYRPFCSKRCADVDLGRWLNGKYAIPVQPDDDEDGDDAAELSRQLSEVSQKDGDEA